MITSELIKIMAIYLMVELFEWSSSIAGIYDNQQQITKFQAKTYAKSITYSYILTIILGLLGLYILSFFEMSIWIYLMILFFMLWTRDALTALIIKSYMLEEYKKHNQQEQNKLMSGDYNAKQ